MGEYCFFILAPVGDDGSRQRGERAVLSALDLEALAGFFRGGVDGKSGIAVKVHLLGKHCVHIGAEEGDLAKRRRYVAGRRLT